MKTLLGNYFWLIIAVLYSTTLHSIEPSLQITKEELALEENLLRLAQQEIEDPYHQYVQAFIWLKQLKGNASAHVDISHLRFATKSEQRTAKNILFPQQYMTHLYFNTYGILHQFPKNKFLQFFWPGRLILLAWYPMDIHEPEFSSLPTEEELLQAAAKHGYLTEELQLQHGISTKKIRQSLQALQHQRIVTHLHQKDAESLLHLLLQDDPTTYQNFVENEAKILRQTQDRYLESQNSERIFLLSSILALTRPLNSLRDFFESWGCCPV